LFHLGACLRNKNTLLVGRLRRRKTYADGSSMSRTT
jgi:hypothetical protein